VRWVRTFVGAVRGDHWLVRNARALLLAVVVLLVAWWICAGPLVPLLHSLAALACLVFLVLSDVGWWRDEGVKVDDEWRGWWGR